MIDVTMTLNEPMYKMDTRLQSVSTRAKNHIKLISCIPVFFNILRAITITCNDDRCDDDV